MTMPTMAVDPPFLKPDALSSKALCLATEASQMNDISTNLLTGTLDNAMCEQVRVYSLLLLLDAMLFLEERLQGLPQHHMLLNFLLYQL
jgi:hypothetical protein